MSITLPSFLQPTAPTLPGPQATSLPTWVAPLPANNPLAPTLPAATWAPGAGPWATPQVGGPGLATLGQLGQAWGNAQAWLGQVWAWAQQQLSLQPLVSSPQPSGAPLPHPQGGGQARFTVSSFNVLGSHHTAPGGLHADYDSGVERIQRAIQLVRARGVEVVGFQELEADQARTFQAVAGQEYGLYPGNQLPGRASLNSIAWRKEAFELVKASCVRMPTHKGSLREVPIVTLKDKRTGKEVIFINVHNAPGYHRGGAQQIWRDRAVAQQSALVQQLRQATGLPIVLTGDFNEKDTAFHKMAAVGMDAANAGPQHQAPRRMGLDWIFGSQGVAFRGFRREARVQRDRISDHAMILSEVFIG